MIKKNFGYRDALKIYVTTKLCTAGAPVAFKNWWGHQYRVGIICPLVGIGLPKLGTDTSPRPQNHMHDFTVMY